jgi:hypothetical protein
MPDSTPIHKDGDLVYGVLGRTRHHGVRHEFVHDQLVHSLVGARDVAGDIALGEDADEPAARLQDRERTDVVHLQEAGSCLNRVSPVTEDELGLPLLDQLGHLHDGPLGHGYVFVIVGRRGPDIFASANHQPLVLSVEPRCVRTNTDGPLPAEHHEKQTKIYQVA